MYIHITYTYVYTYKYTCTCTYTCTKTYVYIHKPISLYVHQHGNFQKKSWSTSGILIIEPATKRRPLSKTVLPSPKTQVIALVIAITTTNLANILIHQIIVVTTYKSTSQHQSTRNYPPFLHLTSVTFSHFPLVTSAPWTTWRKGPCPNVPA